MLVECSRATSVDNMRVRRQENKWRGGLQAGVAFHLGLQAVVLLLTKLSCERVCRFYLLDVIGNRWIQRCAGEQFCSRAKFSFHMLEDSGRAALPSSGPSDGRLLGQRGDKAHFNGGHSYPAGVSLYAKLFETVRGMCYVPTSHVYRAVRCG